MQMTPRLCSTQNQTTGSIFVIRIILNDNSSNNSLFDFESIDIAFDRHIGCVMSQDIASILKYLFERVIVGRHDYP